MLEEYNYKTKVVRVQADGAADGVLINEADFDPDIHKKFGERGPKGDQPKPDTSTKT